MTEKPDFDPSMTRDPAAVYRDAQRLRAERARVRDRRRVPHPALARTGTGARRARVTPKTSAALSSAFAKNPYLHLFVASGYYDLATPYFATDYTFDHLALDAEPRTHLQTEKYPVGHMVYLEINTLSKLKADVAAFIRRATGATPRRLSHG